MEVVFLTFTTLVGWNLKKKWMMLSFQEQLIPTMQGITFTKKEILMGNQMLHLRSLTVKKAM